MSNLDRNNLLEEILHLIEKHKVTAYKISKDTHLSEVGVNKIINGDSKRPHLSTLREILNYLHNSYVNPNNSQSATGNAVNINSGSNNQINSVQSTDANTLSELKKENQEQREEIARLKAQIDQLFAMLKK